MKIPKLIDSLIRLNEVENALAVSKSAPDDLTRERDVARLRRIIPEPYLEHYQQRRLRKKRGITAVVEGICRSCFLRLPSGTLQQLRSEQELLACPKCGAFIYDGERQSGTNVTKTAKSKAEAKSAAAAA
jgi:predicted  nucleic acid-binding Zn-ribbon protein